jgi:hypothetical protein
MEGGKCAGDQRLMSAFLCPSHYHLMLSTHRLSAILLYTLHFIPEIPITVLFLASSP